MMRTMIYKRRWRRFDVLKDDSDDDVSISSQMSWRWVWLCIRHRGPTVFQDYISETLDIDGYTLSECEVWIQFKFGFN